MFSKWAIDNYITLKLQENTVPPHPLQSVPPYTWSLESPHQLKREHHPVQGPSLPGKSLHDLQLSGHNPTPINN